MRDCKLTVEEGVITGMEMPKERPARLFVPKDAVGFDGEMMICGNPDAIEVEAGSPVYTARNNCLLSADGKTLVLACKNSVIPDDGSVEVIGDMAFNYPQDLSEMPLDPLVIPDGIKRIGYRAFALYSDSPIHIIVPASVERVECMAFMMRSETGACRVTFRGSPELEPGVFGTKAEAADSDHPVYHEMPSIIYTEPDKIAVDAPAGSSAAAYCSKYGIPKPMRYSTAHNDLVKVFGFNNFGRDRSLSVNEPEDVYLAVCAAYRDMTVRTITGFGDVEDWKKAAIRLWLTFQLIDYFKGDKPKDQAKFDDDHHMLCDDFIKEFKAILNNEKIGDQITYGKAQKIVNMAFKNLYCFSDAQKEWFLFCHMALDSYILDWVKKEVKVWYDQENKPVKMIKDHFPSWSNLAYDDNELKDKYSYSWIQNVIRDYLKSDDNKKYRGEEEGLAPFFAEFYIWRDMVTPKSEFSKEDFAKLVKSHSLNDLKKIAIDIVKK